MCVCVCVCVCVEGEKGIQKIIWIQKYAKNDKSKN